MPTNATQLKKLLIAERKSMREKQKNSAFLRKTLSIYNGMKKRAKELGRESEIDFGITELRGYLTDVAMIDCPYCRTQKLTLSHITVDHDIPVARGGSFAMLNLRACCKSCNWQKGQLRYDEFAELLDLLDSSAFAPIARTDVKRRLTIGGKWSFKS